jgi:two-component system sensor histidine kinase/response regulator
MGHELRTPLNAIIGYSEMLIEEARDLEQEDFIPDLEKINRAGTELLGLINDTLDYARIEAGKVQIEQADFQLDEVMEKLTSVLSPKIDAKGGDLSLDIGPDLPKALTGDPLRLSQVLINLCNTAITVGETGVQIVVAAELDDQSAEEVVLHFLVRNAAIDVSAEQQGSFFQAFGQADGATTRKYGGTGLGITLARRLTEMMGGEIWVQTGPGKYSTFHFTARLGRQQGETARQETMVEGRLQNRDNVQESIARLRGARILVVEDNEINQDLAVGLLASNGLSAEIANNGQEALAMLDTGAFDGVLMDCHMPVMDGYTATRKIRQQKRYENLPVIAMTANTVEEERTEVLAAGMNDHIAKPINVNAMLQTMARWIAAAIPAAGAEQPQVIDDDASTLPEQLAGIDIAAGLERAQGNSKLYLKLLTKFRDSQRDFATQFQQAQQATDAESALRCAHTLKGVAGNIGAKGVEGPAEALEQACKLGKSEIEINSLLEAVTKRLTPVIDGLSLLEQPANTRDTHRMLDLAAVQPVLSTLRGLLEEDDADAVQVLEELSSLLGGTPHAEDLAVVAAHVDEFDFEAAVAALGKLENALSSV